VDLLRASGLAVRPSYPILDSRPPPRYHNRMASALVHALSILYCMAHALCDDFRISGAVIIQFRTRRPPSRYRESWAISPASTLSVNGPSRPLRLFQSMGRLARFDSFSQWAVSPTATLSVAGPPSPLRRHQSLGLLARGDAFSQWAVSPAATLSVAGPSHPLRRFQSLGHFAHCDSFSRWAISPVATLSVAGPSRPLRRCQSLGLSSRMALEPAAQLHG
jgi:hypothetical protein